MQKLENHKCFNHEVSKEGYFHWSRLGTTSVEF